SSEEELHREFASLSFLRDHHPLLLFSRSLQHVKRVKACDLASYENRYITLIGYQITQKQVLTKGGENMSFVSFEDETALYETVLFPQLFSKYHHLLCTQWPLVILGLVKNDEGALIVEIEHMKKLGS
ncbi:MAG: DNA polymerase III subunit alpha, partial [Spirochaetales bacterium]|nr:DNA polymerase III subunit alpha [Spirochaetales bacterium]